MYNRNQRTSLLIFLFFLAIPAAAQEFYPIWPEGKKPNTNGKAVRDSLFNERIWQVSTPGFYAFPVPKTENTGTSVLICPGGGYERLSYIYNGFQVARWFNAHGINAYVLLYRLPHQADLKNRALAPLQDAQRALRVLRSKAAAWGLHDDKIGIFGISAGGHVASLAGVYADDAAALGDSLDKVSRRPNFMVLVSPVISMGAFAHAGSKSNLLGAKPAKKMIDAYSCEKLVSTLTPPAFIVHAQNDSTVRVENSILFNAALVGKRVGATLHIFPQGGHAIKMHDNPGSLDQWPQLMLLWLKEKGYLLSPKKED